eukprot:g12711.t1
MATRCRHIRITQLDIAVVFYILMPEIRTYDMAELPRSYRVIRNHRPSINNEAAEARCPRKDSVESHERFTGIYLNYNFNFNSDCVKDDTNSE